MPFVSAGQLEWSMRELARANLDGSFLAFWVLKVMGLRPGHAVVVNASGNPETIASLDKLARVHPTDQSAAERSRTGLEAYYYGIFPGRNGELWRKSNYHRTMCPLFYGPKRSARFDRIVRDTPVRAAGARPYRIELLDGYEGRILEAFRRRQGEEVRLFLEAMASFVCRSEEFSEQERTLDHVIHRFLRTCHVTQAEFEALFAGQGYPAGRYYQGGRPRAGPAA